MKQAHRLQNKDLCPAVVQRTVEGICKIHLYNTKTYLMKIFFLLLVLLQLLKAPGATCNISLQYKNWSQRKRIFYLVGHVLNTFTI